MFFSSPILKKLPTLISYQDFFNYIESNLWTAQVDVLLKDFNDAANQELPWAELHLLFDNDTLEYEFAVPRWDLPDTTTTTWALASFFNDLE